MQRRFDDIQIGSIELFCLAAELGSFTAAANAAGLTPPAVSRSIARLEARLGVRLFARTTRAISLTESGQTYFEQCRQALGQLSDAERAVTGQQEVPSGRLRISLPTPYGHYRILPLLPVFRAKFPEVRVEVNLSNRNVDFTTEGYDLAIRGRAGTDSSLIARKLEDADLAVVATPGYLTEFGYPETLDDLQEHDCIQFNHPSTGRPVPWMFRDRGDGIEMLTHGHICCSGDLLGAVTTARNGGGLLQTYRFIVEDDLRESRLVEVLKGYGGRSRPFSLLYPERRYQPLRLRAFIEFLIEELDSTI